MWSAQARRNGASVIPAIGARKTLFRVAYRPISIELRSTSIPSLDGCVAAETYCLMLTNHFKNIIYEP